MFEGLTRHRIETSQSVMINLVAAGTGHGLLLLHGCPETLVMWHKIAPAFAEDFAVVVSDLRGYGDSSKPPGGRDHWTYSFHAMAQDQVAVMEALGHHAFMVVGHDRGARVVHRMALDYPRAVRKAAVLDILPSLTLYEETDAQFARTYWEWFFLIQAYDFPETLIGARPEKFLRYELGALVDSGVIAQEAWNEYLRCISDPSAIHAMCDDYRAGRVDRRRARSQRSRPEDHLSPTRPLGREEPDLAALRHARPLAATGGDRDRGGAPLRPLPPGGSPGRDLRPPARVLLRPTRRAG
jgi:haloacetate dehalogenase